MEELEPCPFCGNKHDITTSVNVKDGKPLPYYFLECEETECLVGPFWTEEELIKAWNNRKYLDTRLYT